MKKIFFGLVATVFLGVFSVNAQKRSEIGLDALFKKIILKGKEIKSDNVLYVSYKFNSETKSANSITFSEKEPTFFILDNPKLEAEGYNVSCYKGDKLIWEKSCNNKFDCGGNIIAKLKCA